MISLYSCMRGCQESVLNKTLVSLGDKSYQWIAPGMVVQLIDDGVQMVKIICKVVYNSNMKLVYDTGSAWGEAWWSLAAYHR